MTVLIAVLVTAGLCGILSNPHNRYGAGIMWIATLASALVPMLVAANHPPLKRSANTNPSSRQIGCGDDDDLVSPPGSPIIYIAGGTLNSGPVTAKEFGHFT